MEARKKERETERKGERDEERREGSEGGERAEQRRGSLGLTEARDIVGRVIEEVGKVQEAKKINHNERHEDDAQGREENALHSNAEKI